MKTNRIKALVLLATTASFSIAGLRAEEKGKMMDGAMMKDGKMMMVKNGKSMMMDKDMTMSNGTKVMKDGKIMMKDGKSTMMKDGQMWAWMAK